MATVIQIKRSANVGAPTTGDLVEGELAYSYDKANDGVGAKLYVEVLDSGNAETIHAIGGKYYTDVIDTATNNNTASKLVKRDASGNFSANVITANEFIGNITGTITGQASSAVIANTANALTTGRYINLSGDVSGSAFFDGTGNAEISATVIQTNAVALGTDTTGDYVSNVLAGTGIVVSGQGGETATPTVALATSGVTADTYGSASKVPVITVDTYGRITSAANVSVAGVTNFAASGNTFTISTADGGSFSASIQADSVRLGTDTTGDYVSNVVAGTGIVVSNQGGENAAPSVALGTSGVSAGTYGTATNVSQVVVDTYGRVTSASNVAIAIPASALTTDVALGSGTSGAYVANLIAGTGITLSGLGDEGTTPTITNAGVVSVAGTSNEIEVSAGTGAVTIGLPNDVTIGNNLTVTGDLIVNGTALTINTATVTVEDPLVKFGNANPADSLDIGFFGAYTSSGEKFAGLFRDASDSGKFKLFVDLTTDPTTNVINTANYTVATLVSNLTGGTVSGLASAIAVADGGTGATTLTTNGVLYGQGTSAVALATGTAGQVLQLNGSGVPVFAGLDGGSY